MYSTYIKIYLYTIHVTCNMWHIYSLACLRICSVLVIQVVRVLEQCLPSSPSTRLGQGDWSARSSAASGVKSACRNGGNFEMIWNLNMRYMKQLTWNNGYRHLITWPCAALYHQAFRKKLMPASGETIVLYLCRTLRSIFKKFQKHKHTTVIESFYLPYNPT